MISDINQYFDKLETQKERIERINNYINNSEYVARQIEGKEMLDILAAKIKRERPELRSLKLENKIIDIVFKGIDYLTDILNEDPIGWYALYNKSILPYLDLSKYNFKEGYRGANLKGHTEIVTGAVAKRTGKKQLFHLTRRIATANLNGIDLSGEEEYILHGIRTSDFRNTNLKVGGIDKYNNIYTTIWNTSFETADLSKCKIEHRVGFSSFKNTGAKVSFKICPSGSYANLPEKEAFDMNSKARYGVYRCNFIGCEIIDLTRGSLEDLRAMKTIPFDETTIEYDEQLYTGTEEIHKLVDKVTGDVMLGVRKKPKQKTIGQYKNN